MNTIGTSFRLTSIGESHGKLVGVVLDGCPAGLTLDKERLQADLNRRRPGQSKVSTTRDEKDKAMVLTGIYKGVTTGAPITMIINNTDKDSSKYHEMRWTPRPGHADYNAELRYGGYQDPRGGGRFSGRNTAPLVMAGVVAKQLLETLGTRIIAYTQQIGDITTPIMNPENIEETNIVRCPHPETAEAMISLIEETRDSGDSVGGKVRCVALHPPVGLGQPIFDTIEGDIAKALYGIPAVKAVEFGAGVNYAGMKGSEANDQFIIRDGSIVTETNNCGGVLGGITHGMPIEVCVTFKPTPSIGRTQRTIDIKKMKETSLTIEGRHDPCIVPRAVPIVEAMMAVTLVDHALRAGKIKQVLGV